MIARPRASGGVSARLLHTLELVPLTSPLAAIRGILAFVFQMFLAIRHSRTPMSYADQVAQLRDADGLPSLRCQFSGTPRYVLVTRRPHCGVAVDGERLNPHSRCGATLARVLASRSTA